MATTVEPPLIETSRSDAREDTVFTSTVAPRPAGKERLVSLDVFRGITVAGMLLVMGSATAILRVRGGSAPIPGVSGL